MIEINWITDKPVIGVTADSREVKKDYAFVAINGFKENGNKYINDAISRGAAVIYTEIAPVGQFFVPIIIVDNARLKLAELAAKIYGHPSKKLNLIGVSGTNGKTTTTYLIHHLLNQGEMDTGLLGTIDYKLGNDSIPAKLTTPDVAFTQKFLRQLVEQKSNGAVMEVSSHGIKLHRVDYLDFDLGMYTNLAADHYDLHPDFKDYLNTKKMWFDSLKEDACLIYNVDDPFWTDVVAHSPAETKISYGINGQGLIQGNNISISSKGICFDLVITEQITGKAGKIGSFSWEPQTIPVKVAMYGEHNCYNILAAVTAGLVCNICPQQITQSLSNFSGVWRRFQLINRQPFTIVDDATHNPQNFRAVFETAQKLPYNQLWIIAGIRGSRGWQINYENAQEIGRYAHQLKGNLIVTKSLDTNGQLDKIYEDEEKAFMRGLWEKKVEFELLDLLADALRKVMSKVAQGDLVLLLGAHPFDNVSQMIKPYLELATNKNFVADQLTPSEIVTAETFPLDKNN